MGYFAFFKKYFGLHIRTALEYKMNFVFQSLFMFLNNVFFIVFWFVIFSHIDTLRGWSFSDVIVLFAAGAVGYGFISFFLGNWSRMTRIIEQGDLDFYLALPKDELLHVLVAKSDFYGVGDILFGLVVALVFLHPLLVLPFMIVSFLGGLIWASLMIIISSLSFVLGKAEGPTEIASSAVFALTTYPYTIFPLSLQLFFFVAFPVFFISNVPVMIVTSFSWMLVGLLLVVTTVFAIIAWFVFRLGLKRYESGNLVTMRT